MEQKRNTFLETESMGRLMGKYAVPCIISLLVAALYNIVDYRCVLEIPFFYLQSLGKAISSTLLSLVREVVFGVGFALILPWFFGLDGVLYSMPVSDILTAVIAAVLIVKTYRELSRKENDRLERTV